MKNWVGGVIHYAGGLVDAVLMVRGVANGKRDPNYLLKCSHNECSASTTQLKLDTILFPCRK